MKAAVVTRFGPPSVLQLEDIPKPEVRAGEALVRTTHVGLNFADVLARVGVYPGIPEPPFVAGIEFTGIIESVGPAVKGLSRGDRVMGFTRQGAYAEYVRADSESLIPVPKKMKPREAAAFLVTYFSAYHGMKTLANIGKGEKMLLHAAAGGVGTAALQLAKYWGVEVFATVGSQEKLEVARKQGAQHVINYRTEDFALVVRRETGGEGLDVVMDSVGGSVMKKSWGLLAPMGRYVIYGFAAVTGRRRLDLMKAAGEVLRTPWIFPPNLVSKNVSLIGFNLYFLTHKVAYFRKVAKELLGLYDRKLIKPVIGGSFPLEKISDAHAYLQSRKSIGKIVIEV